MVFVKKTLPELLEEVKVEACVFEDVLNPESNPERFGYFEMNDGSLVLFPRNTYRRHILEMIDSKVNSSPSICNGPEGYYLCFTEMLLNSLARGKPPVELKFFSGERGCVLRLEDSGSGFDYISKIKQMRKKEKFYKNCGAGLKNFEKTPYDFSYEGNGNIINMRVFVGED